MCLSRNGLMQKVRQSSSTVRLCHSWGMTRPKTGNNCVAVISLRYELEKYKALIRACDCRTTLLVRRQVTHTYKSQWSDPRLMSFIQGQEESGHTVMEVTPKPRMWGNDVDCVTEVRWSDEGLPLPRRTLERCRAEGSFPSELSGIPEEHQATEPWCSRSLLIQTR